MAQAAKDTLIAYIQENQERLYKMAYMYTRNQELALDVVQEAITKSLENIAKLRQEEFVKTWFYRILINESLKVVRKNKKIIECELQEDAKYLQSHEETLVENLDIYQSLQKLEIKTRTVILLRFFENLKIEEIAKITHTNTNTVKSRLYKGLREMRKDMEKHYSEKIE